MCCSVFCSVVQCGAVCCSVLCLQAVWLQLTVTVCYIVLQCVLHRVALCCNVLTHYQTEIHCNTMQRIATHCNTPVHPDKALWRRQRDCNTLQHTATHCNTLHALIQTCKPYQCPSKYTTNFFAETKGTFAETLGCFVWCGNVVFWGGNVETWGPVVEM